MKKLDEDLERIYLDQGGVQCSILQYSNVPLSSLQGMEILD
jgi:hypothetical protein